MAANFDSELFRKAVVSVRGEPQVGDTTFAQAVYEHHRAAALGDAYNLREMADRYFLAGLPMRALREDLEIAADLIALAAGPRVLRPEEYDNA